MGVWLSSPGFVPDWVFQASRPVSCPQSSWAVLGIMALLLASSREPAGAMTSSVSFTRGMGQMWNQQDSAARA